MESIRIVPAQSADVPVILQLIKSLGEYERLSHEVVATEDDLREWLFGSQPAAEVVLAYRGNVPVGYALFFQTFSTFLGTPGLYLEDLFVVPDWRGRGIGSQLMRHVASLAAQRGYGRMEWAVLDWNESAIGFYQRLGARVMGDWRLCRLTGEALQRVASARA